MATKASQAAETGNGNGPLTRAEQGTREKLCRTVRIRGLTPIKFDRYPGDNDTRLEPWQKLYFGEGKRLVLPSANLESFLSAQNTDSAPKRLLDSRKYKRFGNACGSYVQIDPLLIPFSRDGAPVVFGRLDGDRDALSGVWIDRGVARLEKGVPNPKVRPVLPLPWELEFQLTLYPNREIQEQQLLNVFTEGGIAVGLGTHRPRFGKFEVVHWE
jgi:hypothetical protein